MTPTHTNSDARSTPSSTTDAAQTDGCSDERTASATTESRRTFLRTVGTAAVFGAGSAAQAGSAAGQEDATPVIPLPPEPTVVDRLDRSVQIGWSDVAGADSYEYGLADGGLGGVTSSTSAVLRGLEPETSYEIEVRAISSSGGESSWSSVTVTTAPVADSYPVTVETSVDPERTSDDGLPGVVLSVSDLPEDAAIEHYQLTVSGQFGTFADEVRPMRGEADADDGPLVVTRAEWEGTEAKIFVTGTATGDPPTAADEPIELATVFHEEVDETTVPFDVDLNALVGVEGRAEGLAPWDVRERGIEEWSFTTTDEPEVGADEPPQVTFDGDRIVVSGAAGFPRLGCDSVAPQRIAFSDRMGRLGVVVEEFATHELDPDTDASDVACADALSTVGYELTVVPEGSAASVIVDEWFSDDDRTIAYRDGEPELDLPDEIADYELELGDYGPDGRASENDPTVSFESDEIVVEGELTYGSSSCSTIGVREIVAEEDAEGHVAVTLEPQRQETLMPGDACTDDIASAGYRLTLTTASEGAVQTVTATEKSAAPGHDRSVTVEREDDGRDLPEAVLDYELLTTREVDDQHAVEDDPSVSFERPGEDAPDEAAGVVVVDGAIRLSSGSCNRAAVTQMNVYDGTGSDKVLSVRIDDVRRDDYEEGTGCTMDAPAVQYELRATVDRLLSAVKAEEGSDDGEPLRSVSVDRGCRPAVEIDGQSVCDVDGDGLYRDVTGDEFVGQTDVVRFFERQHREAWKRPALFDFSGDGAVGHGDVVSLFEHVARR